MERDYLSSLLNLFRKRINKIFVGLLVIIIAACDFESPSDFVVPTWFIDIKLPLVSKRFPMGNLVDSVWIYPTDDTAGFQILFGGVIDPPVGTEDTDLYVPFEGGYIEQDIPPSPIPGVDGSSISIPAMILPINLSALVLYDTPIYPDTADLYQLGIKIADYTPFSLPIDTVHTMTAEDYNQLFVDPVNTVLSAILDSLNNLDPISLGLSSLIEGIEPQVITSIDSLIIAGSDASPSYFTSLFKNNGYPTNLTNCYARFVGGIDALNDTIANHDTTMVGSIIDSDSSTFSAGIFQKTTNLVGEGLTENLQITTYFQLDQAPDDSYVTLYPTANDSIYIDYKLQFNISGIDSAKVSIDSVSLDLSEQIDAIKSQLSFTGNLPEVEGTSLEIFGAIMESSNIPLSANKFTISNLQSTFPWDINFYLGIPNFFPPPGNSPVLIDRVLRNADEPFNQEISLKGDTLRAMDPDSAIGSLELDLAVIIPEQMATIPLDGSSLGGFGVTIRFGSLYFNELQAYVFKELTADTMDIAGFPPELSGIGFPELEFEFEIFNEIDLPVLIDIAMLGTKPTGEPVVTRLIADLGVPGEYGADTVKTMIRWSDAGNEISHYALPNSFEAIWDTLMLPLPGEFSIIDFFSSMPLTAIADVKARLDGRGAISSSAKKIWGSFTIKMPFSVTMNAPPFIPPTGISKLPEFSPDNRNKIRHSLIHSELAMTVENSLPLGGDFAILLSDQPFFPKDITDEALDAFVDTMVNQGQLGWDSNDSLYIVTDCESLSPADSVIYIFNVMSDSSECVNDVKYLVKINDAGMDTVVSYVDTLFRVLLPSPDSLYQETNSEGHKGQVAVPGILSYSSVLDTGRIFLLTDYGDHYIVPRFSFNKTGDEGVFFSRYDAIDIKSFITFRVASTGVLGPTENDIVLIRPNGGENFTLGIEDTIIWTTYGDVSTFDVQYASGANPTEDDWQPIILNYASNDSITKYLWTWQSADNLYRVRVKDSNSDLQDISGWYFSVSGGSGVNTSDGNEVVNKTSDGNEVINNTKMKKPEKLHK